MLRVLLATLVLAGCAAKAPAPIGESRPVVRVENGTSAPPAAVAEGKVHAVKKGDTLRGIAREYGLNGQDIAAWNNLDNPNHIVPGQRLRLTSPQAQASDVRTVAESVEVQPIAASGGVVARPLDAAAPSTSVPAARPADAVTPAPSLLTSNSETLKRAPKGGKLPYSEANLALLKGQTPAPAPVVPATVAASPSPPPPVAATPAPTLTPPPTPDRSSAPLLATGIEWGWPATGRLLGGYSEGAGMQGLNRGVDIAGKIGDPVLAAASGKVIFVGVYPKHGNLVVLLHAEGYSSVYAHTHRSLVKEGEVVKRGQHIADLGNSDADQPKLHFEVRQQGKPLDPLRVLPPR